jgi:uncharacterized protein (DUF1697 family)
MPVIICMLRGVNVVGHNMIKMRAQGALRVTETERPSDLCPERQRYLQQRRKDLSKLAKRIQDAIKNAHGFWPGVVLRTVAELREIVARNPFAKRSNIRLPLLLAAFTTL